MEYHGSCNAERGEGDKMNYFKMSIQMLIWLVAMFIAIHAVEAFCYDSDGNKARSKGYVIVDHKIVCSDECYGDDVIKECMCHNEQLHIDTNFCSTLKAGYHCDGGQCVENKIGVNYVYCGLPISRWCTQRIGVCNQNEKQYPSMKICEREVQKDWETEMAGGDPEPNLQACRRRADDVCYVSATCKILEKSFDTLRECHEDVRDDYRGKRLICGSPNGICSEKDQCPTGYNQFSSLKNCNDYYFAQEQAEIGRDDPSLFDPFRKFLGWFIGLGILGALLVIAVLVLLRYLGVMR